MKTSIEPFRIKMVEPITFTTRKQREVKIKEAGYNPFLVKAEDVTIDLLTDSGTSAMSSDQWAAMMTGDESYAQAKSWFRFESAVKKIFGFKHVIPTHQGRASERLLFGEMVSPGQYVPNNTHFDTTRANIEFKEGRAVDLVCEEGKHPSLEHPFKGNINLEKLEALLADKGAKQVPLAMITITNNSGGGQPVSMANIREVGEIAHRYGVPFYIDACRFAENAYFIKTREQGYENKSIFEICAEMFSYADGCTMSAKKDAFANIGGFICTNDDNLAIRLKNALILTEGYSTYGGLSGRDLDAIAVGLTEIIDDDYLEYRIKSTAYVADSLSAIGVPVVKPAGGHAVYIDGRAFLSHIDPLNYPAWSLSVELYIEAGVRGCEIGTVMFGYDPETDTEKPSPMDLVRLAIPRRVYTKSHMDYVIEAVELVWNRRKQIGGLKILDAPKFLRHFTAKLAPL